MSQIAHASEAAPLRFGKGTQVRMVLSDHLAPVLYFSYLDRSNRFSLPDY